MKTIVPNAIQKSFHAGTAIGILLCIGVLAAELVNWATTRFGMQIFLGAMTVEGINVPIWGAIAVVALDIAGIARMFTPQTGDEEPEWVIWLFIGWFVTTVINGFLTWWSIASSLLTETIPPSPIDAETLRIWVPILGAFFLWLIHAGMIVTLAMIGSDLFAPIHKGGRNLFTRIGSGNTGGFRPDEPFQRPIDQPAISPATSTDLSVPPQMEEQQPGESRREYLDRVRPTTRRFGLSLDALPLPHR